MLLGPFLPGVCLEQTRFIGLEASAAGQADQIVAAPCKHGLVMLLVERQASDSSLENLDICETSAITKQRTSRRSAITSNVPPHQEAGHHEASAVIILLWKRMQPPNNISWHVCEYAPMESMLPLKLRVSVGAGSPP